MPGEHMSPEEFRRWGHALVDWLAAYRGRVESLPVLSQVKPGDVRAALPAAAPEQGEDFAALLADVDRVVLPGVTHWQSPNFFAYFPGNSSGPSILGELLSAGGYEEDRIQDRPGRTERRTEGDRGDPESARAGRLAAGPRAARPRIHSTAVR